MNTDDLNFAYRVRHALNEQLDQLPASASDRLAKARKIAVSRKKAEAPLALAGRALAGHAGQFVQTHLGWMTRLGVALPLLVLVAGLSGIYQYEQQQRINEIAELDAAALTDELPLNAYLDEGFNAYVTQQERVQ
ncbi:DUF3619 family protein [Massilia sp. TS11]|uniref:DUF3619 family protein n=1 Tax=Massilia sp. TS11 TaxID=2908003 RepID=UPI001EDA1239|nr:DUF3619 family protein [Massilia sp. TS11]MCG2583208.1 DUF3619 family protein [Massilia sp. TS11]